MSTPAQTHPLDDEAARANLPASQFDRGWIQRHLADERRKASLLGEIREAIFGAQDGLVSTLAVASTVAGASADRFPVLVAGMRPRWPGSSAWRPASTCRARASGRSSRLRWSVSARKWLSGRARR